MRRTPPLRPDTHGFVHGVTLKADGLPFESANVTIRNRDGDVTRRATTAPDGTFTVDGLKSGSYEVAAAKEGFATPSSTTVDVAQDKVAEVRISGRSSCPARTLICSVTVSTT